MHKVKTSNRLDLIDCWGVQSAVALYLYKGGGLDPLPTDFRVNPAVLGNKSREKLGTITDSAHARTVHATTADSPASGPDRPHGHFGFQHMPPCLLVKFDEPKAYELNLIVTPGFGRQTECELCTCQDQNSRTQRLHK
jgi:hypothetical protein